MLCEILKGDLLNVGVVMQLNQMFGRGSCWLLFLLALMLIYPWGKAAGECELRFNAAAVKDTVLTHESTFIVFVHKNTGTTDIQYLRSYFLSDFIDVAITNTVTGEDLPFCTGRGHYSTRGNFMTLPVGDSVLITSDILLLGSCLVDTYCLAPMRVMPLRKPGTYEATFKFAHDDWNRADCSASQYLFDTVRFTVIENPLQERLALEELKKSLCPRLGEVDERANSLWRMMKEYPDSRYANESARYIAFGLAGGKNFPHNVDGIDIMQELALRRPYDEDIANVMGVVWSHVKKRDKTEKVSKLVDALPKDSLVRLKLLELSRSGN